MTAALVLLNPFAGGGRALVLTDGHDEVPFVEDGSGSAERPVMCA